MSLRINNSHISKMKINGSNISLAKINGKVVFQLQNATITLTFTDKTIQAVSDTTGSYDFYYANDNGIIEGYDKIVSFDLKANITSSYTYLNSFNVAPYGATKMAVCKIGTTKILSSSSLPSQFLFDSTTYGNKIYSFGALSDVHIDGDGDDQASASSDFARALKFFNSKASLVAISGDLCNENGYNELSLFKNLVDTNSTIPVYASRGNHDTRYTLEEFENNIGGSLYYEKTYNNDVFIFLGMNAEHYGDNCFTTEEIDWLETKLEGYKNQRVFLFFHVFMSNTCGNINGLYPYSSLNTNSSIVARFVSLMTNYKNVIYFSGHSHLEFACQRFGANANIFSNGTTCHRVHIPSCAKPRLNNNGTSSSDTYSYYAGSEGYLVDVYENCIVLRGRDFAKAKYLPIANYCLDTTIIETKPEQSSNLFTGSDILLTNTGSSYTSPKTRSGITYTFSSNNPIITMSGTATSNPIQYFEQNNTLYAGKTYKFTRKYVSGEINLGTKSYFAAVSMVTDHLNADSTYICDKIYIEGTKEDQLTETTFTPNTDITKWYIGIQHRSSEVSCTDYAVEIIVEEVVEEVNLYDYSTASTLDAYISRSSYTIKSSTTDKTTYLQIEPNSKYKVTKTASTRFVIGTFSDVPEIGGASGSKVIDDYTGTTLYITSGENDNYLAIQYYVTSDTLTEEALRQSIQVVKVENTTENNLMPDFVASSGTVAGVTYNFIEGTDKFTLSGTASSSSHIYSPEFAMNLIVGKTYAFRFNVISGSIDASAHEDSYYDKNLISVDDTGATAKMVEKDDVETPFHEQQFVVTQTYPYYKINIKLKSNDIYTNTEIEVEVVQLD